jgi:hypothetical protein
MKLSVFWSRLGMILGICLKALFVVLLVCWLLVLAIGARHVIAGTTPLRIGHVVGALIPPFVFALALVAFLHGRAKHRNQGTL